MPVDTGDCIFALACLLSPASISCIIRKLGASTPPLRPEHNCVRHNGRGSVGGARGSEDSVPVCVLVLDQCWQQCHPQEDSPSVPLPHDHLHGTCIDPDMSAGTHTGAVERRANSTFTQEVLHQEDSSFSFRQSAGVYFFSSQYSKSTCVVCSHRCVVCVCVCERERECVCVCV